MIYLKTFHQTHQHRQHELQGGRRCIPHPHCHVGAAERRLPRPNQAATRQRVGHPRRCAQHRPQTVKKLRIENLT
jgi:hypothetical protein